MKKVNGNEIIQLFESWSPKKLACMPNDPIGLAIGTLNKEVTKVLVTLDVTDAVVEEAIAEGCELIIAHHPRSSSNWRIYERTTHKANCMKSLLKMISLFMRHIQIWMLHKVV